ARRSVRRRAPRRRPRPQRRPPLPPVPRARRPPVARRAPADAATAAAPPLAGILRGRVKLQFTRPFFMHVVRSILTYVLTALYVLVAGPIGLFVAVPLKQKDLLYHLGHAGVALALGLAGIRYKVIGREHVPAGRAVVFCANHQSNVDPPVLFRALHPQLHILYKAELRKLPILGKVFEVGGFVAIERE